MQAYCTLIDDQKYVIIAHSSSFSLSPELLQMHNYVQE